MPENLGELSSSLPEIGTVKQTFRLAELPVSAESSIAELDRFQQEWGEDKGKALYALKEVGLIDTSDEIRDEEGRRTIIFEIDKFSSRSVGYRELKFKLGSMAVMGRQRHEDRSSSVVQYKPVTMAMMDIFQGVVGYSREDFQKKINYPDNLEIGPKPLFIIPTTDEVISPKLMQDTPGYLGLWAVNKGSHNTLAYPTQKDGFASTLSMQTFRLMALIFHSSYGNAAREGGRIMVTYPNGKRGPITGEFFRDYGFIGISKDSVSGSISYSPAQWLRQRYPKWYEQGWIHSNDFRTQKGGGADTIRLEDRPIGTKGQIMLEGVRYTLGTEYEGMSATIIENGKYALVAKTNEDGSRQTVKILELMRQDEVKTDASGYLYASKGGLEGRLSSPEQFLTDHPELFELIDKNQEYLQFSERLYADFQISLVNMSAVEQAMVYRVAKTYGQDERFWKFLANYNGDGIRKIDGLRTFLVAQQELQHVEALLEIGPMTLGPMIVGRVAEIVKTVTRYQSMVGNIKGVTEREMLLAQDIGQLILMDTGRLVFAAMHAHDGEMTWVTASQMTKALNAIEEQVEEVYQNRFGTSYPDQNNLFNQLMQAYDNMVGRSELHTEAGKVAAWNVYGDALLRRIESSQDAGAAQHALEQMVIFCETHPTALVHGSELMFRGNHRILYRVLARASFGVEDKKRIMGTVLLYSDMGDEIQLLRAMAKDTAIGAEERNQLQELLNQMLGALPNETAPDVPTFYRNFNYAEYPSHLAEQEIQHAQNLAIFRKYGITNNSCIRDFGCGFGEWVARLQQQGYLDVRGLDIVPEHIQTATDTYGNLFDLEDWQEFPYEHMDAVTFNTRTIDHAIGWPLKRKLLDRVVSRMNPGGIILFNTANPEKEGSHFHSMIETGRNVLRHFELPEEVVENTWISVGRPGGKAEQQGELRSQVFTRHIPPESEWLEYFKAMGLELVEVIRRPMPHLPNDEDITFVVRKR